LTGTYEKIKEGFKKTADNITDSDTYLGSDAENKNAENKSGGKEPMNPEDIAEHDATAVRRDKNQGGSGEPV
jgi:hypothetical protein